MSSNDREEKKTLIPELLPAPVIARSRMPTPRERVQAHLRSLMRLSAAASAAVMTSCSGYGVVDPLPPPAQCRDSGSQWVTGEATFQANGMLSVLLQLNFQSRGRDSINFEVKDATNVLGGTVQNQAVLENTSSIQVQLTFDANRSHDVLSFDVPLDCFGAGEGAETIRVSVQLDGNVPVGQPLSVEATLLMQ